MTIDIPTMGLNGDYKRQAIGKILLERSPFGKC
jgi:hypothetical protein